jgi:hypothetical protein
METRDQHKGSFVPETSATTSWDTSFETVANVSLGNATVFSGFKRNSAPGKGLSGPAKKKSKLANIHATFADFGQSHEMSNIRECYRGRVQASQRNALGAFFFSSSNISPKKSNATFQGFEKTASRTTRKLIVSELTRKSVYVMDPPLLIGWEIKTNQKSVSTPNRLQARTRDERVRAFSRS